MKFCISCKQWIDPSNFHRSKNTADGLQVQCQECNRDAGRRHHELKPDARRRNLILRRYGLSLEEFDVLLASQDGRCAICLSAEPGARGWQVDHDHTHHDDESGCRECVRGILCGSCNRMIGLAHDDPTVLDNAAAYLR